MYLFDIANRLREDPEVNEALACQLAAEDSPLVVHVVLENSLQETEKERIWRHQWRRILIQRYKNRRKVKES